MRVAAIDVGTNSIHLLVGDVAPSGEITIVEKAREQVELGRGGLDHNRLTPEAIGRGIAAIASFRDAMSGLGVEAINAAATSAVREASNGAAFVRQVRDETGIHVRVISGLDEAQLIWLGARSDLDFSRGYAVLFDLGGGSAEILLCDSSSILASHSLPLGHIRVSEALTSSDPPTRDDINAVRAHTRATLRPVLRDILPGNFGTFVCTSGGVRTLGLMCTLGRGDPKPNHQHGLVIRRDELKQLLLQFQKLKASQLSELPGMDMRRRHTLPSAAAVLYQVMKSLDRDQVVTSERSLRDGLLQDWVVRHQPELSLAKTVAWPKMRSVLRMQERFDVHAAHAEQVRDLSLMLFDGLESLTGLGAESRRTLEFAALLHDVGHHIHPRSHNKHGEYLIRNSLMTGFTAPEVELLACLVRYHRGARPKQRDQRFAALHKSNQRAVQLLSGILRVADGLDRSHNQPIERVDVQTDGEAVVVVAHASDEAHLERWACERRKTLLSTALGRSVEIRVRHPDGLRDLRPLGEDQVE